MPKFMFELPDDWSCINCPYRRYGYEHKYYECAYEPLMRIGAYGRYIGEYLYENPHPDWCPLQPINLIGKTYYIKSKYDCRDGIWCEPVKTFYTIEEAKKYAKSRGWDNPDILMRIVASVGVREEE